MDINDLIHERFDVANAKRNSEVVNGNAQGISERSGSEVNADGVTPEDDHDQPVQPPPRKKQKTGKAESDAAMAARLQAEENGRARPTRGGSSRSSTKKKSSSVRKSPKKKKNKSESKINEDDDSAENSTSEEKKTSKRGGAFNVCIQNPDKLVCPNFRRLLGNSQNRLQRSLGSSRYVEFGALVVCWLTVAVISTTGCETYLGLRQG